MDLDAFWYAIELQLATYLFYQIGEIMNLCCSLVIWIVLGSQVHVKLQVFKVTGTQDSLKYWTIV